MNQQRFELSTEQTLRLKELRALLNEMLPSTNHPNAVSLPIAHYSCGAVCMPGCSAGCTSTCTGTCAGGCTGSCTTICAPGCGVTCMALCRDTCSWSTGT
jgi:hypothetical protein